MARNQEMNRRMRDSRRQKILSASLELFATRGFAAVRISDIAAASGMSQGLVYHYYRSKEKIFTDLIRWAFSAMTDACLYLDKLKASPQKKISLAIGGLLENLSDDPDTARYYMLIAQASVLELVPAEAKTIIKKNSDLPVDIIARIIGLGQRDGTIRKGYKPKEMAVVFWTSIKGLAINKAIQGNDFQMPHPGILMNIFFNPRSAKKHTEKL